MSEPYYSEFGEDRFIVENLALPDHGIYVDVGAAYPQLRSNTAFLRDRGWPGIAIDGNPYYRDQWGNPPLIVAVVSNQSEVTFDYNAVPDLGGIREGGTMVESRSLEGLLVEHGIEHIDLLSLDLEGGEFSALMSMNIARHDPTIIVSEYNTHGIGEDFRVREFLVDIGYRVRHQTVANLIFTR